MSWSVSSSARGNCRDTDGGSKGRTHDDAPSPDGAAISGPFGTRIGHNSDRAHRDGPPAGNGGPSSRIPGRRRIGAATVRRGGAGLSDKGPRQERREELTTAAVIRRPVHYVGHGNLGALGHHPRRRRRIATVIVTASTVGPRLPPAASESRQTTMLGDQFTNSILDLLALCANLQMVTISNTNEEPRRSRLQAERQRWETQIGEVTTWLIDHWQRYALGYVHIAGFGFPGRHPPRYVITVWGGLDISKAARRPNPHAQRFHRAHGHHLS